MPLDRSERALSTIGPSGERLTLQDLPRPDTVRWVIRRKAELVAAIRGGLLTLEEACELYWNELSWEEITDEELVGDEELTEMVFPGLLTLIDAFLPRAANGEPDRDREHRDVAHDFLEWLASRLVELRESSPETEDERVQLRRREAVTDDLIDLIAFRVCSLSNDEIETYQSR